MTREQFVSHVESCQKALRRFLTGLCCGDTQLADDLAQEALIKAYLSREGFSNPEKFNAWIFRIAYNTFLNDRRSQQKTVGYEEAAAIISDSLTDGAFRYQDLYNALNHLTEKERSAILLYYLNGYSIKEICNITNASESAVKQHLSRGRDRLRLLMNLQSK